MKYLSSYGWSDPVKSLTLKLIFLTLLITLTTWVIPPLKADDTQLVSDLEPAADEVPIDYYRDEATGDVWGQLPAWRLPQPTGKLPAGMWQYGLRSIYLAKYACQDEGARKWMPTNIANGIYYCTNPQDRQKTISYLRMLAAKLRTEDQASSTRSKNILPVLPIEPGIGEVPLDYYRDQATGDVWKQQPAWQLPSPTTEVIPIDIWKYGLRSIYLAKYACQDAGIRDWMPTNIANGVYYCTNPQDRPQTINYLLSLAEKLEAEEGIVNSQLAISGSPDTTAYYLPGEASSFEYHFKPTVTKQSDNDVVNFSVSAKPEWAIFDERTGEFRGLPSESDRGVYSNIVITVNDGKGSQSLAPFTVEVKPWQGYSFCSGKNYRGETICGMISKQVAIQAQCESWTDFQGLRTPEIHRDDARQDTLETLADSICNRRERSYDPNSGTCPAGYVVVPQVAEFHNVDSNGLPMSGVMTIAEPRCMEDLPPEKTVERLTEDMLDSVEKYLEDSESEVLPGYTPLEPTLSEPDANGNRTLTLPPPISVQHTLEKQRRAVEVGGNSANIFTDCSALIEQGSSWNRTACFSWKKELGDKKFGVRADAMAYLRLSGDAVASFGITGSLFDESQKIVNFFSKTQVYTLPDEAFTAVELIQAYNKDPEETLKKLLEKQVAGALEGVINPSVIATLREAQVEFKKAKARIDEAVGKTEALIAEANTQFQAAQAKLDEAKAQVNEAIKQAQNGLQTLKAEKTEFVRKFEIAGQIVDDYIQKSENGAALFFEKTWIEKYPFFSPPPWDFPVGPVPVTVKAELTGEVSLKLQGGIENPLDKDNAYAHASITPGLRAVATASAGVGNSMVASIGVETDLTLVQTDVKFTLLAKAADFPKIPLIVADWAADFLKGSFYVYAEVSKTVMRVVNAPARAFNWLKKKIAGGSSVIPEIKISKYRKNLFDWPGFHFPAGESPCEKRNIIPNPTGEKREILYCNRPEECFANVCNNPPPPPPSQVVLNVTTSGNGEVTVNSEVGVIACGTACAPSYQLGDIVTLTATATGITAATPAVLDSEFKQWGGDCTGTSPTVSVVMDGAKKCEATFGPKAKTKPTACLTSRGRAITIRQEVIPAPEVPLGVLSCPTTYSPKPFQGVIGGTSYSNNRSGETVTVVLYHPNSGSVFSCYEVLPGETSFLATTFVDGVVTVGVGDDWGLCLEYPQGSTGIVNNVGEISVYNANIFYIQPERIR